MGKDCRMMEFLKGGIEEDDDNGIELSLGLSIGGNYSTKKMDQVCNRDDKMFLESQMSQKRAIYREMIVSEQTFGRKEEICSFGNECGTYEAPKRLNLALNQEPIVNNQNFAVEFWGQHVGKREKNMLQGEDCGSFRFCTENKGGNLCYNQCRSNESNGSPERCSSTISECRSPSPKGRSSSYNAQGTQPSTSGRNDAKFDPFTSNVISMKHEQGQTVERTTHFGAKIDLSSDKSNYSDSIHNPNLTKQANEGLFSSPLNQSPVPEIKKCDIPLLSRMPRVTTTGNGPNGKTVKGLLYRYDNRKEISIICVCHGKQLTPSEFVEHAGGIDVDHPLRHITVIPPCS